MDKEYSVLIVDDNKSSIIALTHILSPEYNIHAVKSGDKAVAAVHEYKPDVILLDILMPDMDGYSVLSALKDDKIARDIPVIFITGLCDTGSEEKGLTMGAVDYIVKPFDSHIVKLRVANQIKLISQMKMILEKELQAKNHHDKMEFLMNMSHDMLTPMNAIRGMTFLAQRASSPEKLKEYLDEIDYSSQELLTMIKQLLGIPEDDNDGDEDDSGD